jgi:hypothetical protein
MKKGLYIICFLLTGYVAAQDGKTIVEDLNTSRPGQGNVKVMQDETIQDRIAIRYDNSEDSVEGGQIRSSPTPIRGGGFKIQIFMGNNQQQSRREAESKQAQINAVYPGLQTTRTFNSPFWILRVVNIATREDAEMILTELRKQFPSFGKEMYIVPPNR